MRAKEFKIHCNSIIECEIIVNFIRDARKDYLVMEHCNYREYKKVHLDKYIICIRVVPREYYAEAYSVNARSECSTALLSPNKVTLISAARFLTEPDEWI